MRGGGQLVVSIDNSRNTIGWAVGRANSGRALDVGVH